MDISYPTRIVTGTYNGILKNTVEYYNELITYLLHIINKEQTEIIIKDVTEHANERAHRLETLIHATRKIINTQSTRITISNSRNSRHTSAEPPRKRQSAYTNHGTPTTTTGNSPARKEPNPDSSTSTTPHSPSTTRTPTARIARKARITSN